MCQELNARKQENMQMEHNRGNRNNLLEYLRSLDSNMVLHSFTSVTILSCIYAFILHLATRLVVVAAQAVELLHSWGSHSYLHVYYLGD